MRPHALLMALCLAAACPETPRLVIEVAPASLEADGLAHATITVRARDPIEQAVVQLTASGGALSSSAVALTDGIAVAQLYAPVERELGKRESRLIDIVASVTLTADERLEATASVIAVPPAAGVPLLFVDATPPAAFAASGDVITIDVAVRRLAAGTVLVLESDVPGIVGAAEELVVGDDGTARGTVSAPTDPVDATITVRDAASGASGSVVVRFVAAGAPLFDLTGAFAQIGPARVKLASGALTPNPQCTVAPSLVLAQFTQTGTALDASYTTCDVAFPPVTSIVGTVTNVATPAFYAAIPVVTESFGLDSGALGARYAPPPSVVVVGAELDDPENDALPTDETDPRVVDADGDGAPGVTVQNSIGGAQHIVFRNVGSSVGRVVSSNHILGDVVGDLVAVAETSVFGIGGVFLPDTLALGSVIELVRIDGRFGSVDADVDNDGVVSCTELVDVASSVVTLEPPDTPFDCGSER
jgi:hypothetical protein